MIKNFDIIDGVVFSFLGEDIDIRGNCDLIGVAYWPGLVPRIKLDWRLKGSNRSIVVEFSEVEDFRIEGRDRDYPRESSISLAIAGFIDSDSYSPRGNFFVEPDGNASYMAFVMDDMSAFLVKAGIADMRRG